MEDEVYTVEDIFERDTPFTEDLLDNSDGLTLSPITMLRRYMAEKELQKQKENAEEESEEMETDLMESIGYMNRDPGMYMEGGPNRDPGMYMDRGYMNGGGIGSMMQPKQNFLNGGRVGLFMGGSPLEGQALNIYNSMNAYGYDDQTIADLLQAQGYYTPKDNTPPPPVFVPPSPGGGNSGGDGGGGDQNNESITIADLIRKEPRSLSNPNAIFNRPTMRNIAGENSGIISSLPSRQETPSVLDQLISSDELNMRDIAGEDLAVNEDIIDRANLNNDPRIVSEELGSIGYSRPTMRDIAGENSSLPSSAAIAAALSSVGKSNTGRPNMADIANTVSKDNSIAIEDLTSPSNIGDFAITTAEALANQTGMIDGPPSIGFAQNPNVEDPFGGKYTPSFEKQNLTGLESLANKIQGYDFKNAVSPRSIGTGIIGGKIASALNIPAAIGSFALNQLTKSPTTKKSPTVNKKSLREKVTGYKTQSGYEQAKSDRQAQTRADNMVDRISSGKSTRSNPRDAGKTKSQKDAISAAIQDSHRGGGGGGSSGCFIKGTLITMADGSTKEVQKVDLGDNVAKGGKVFATGKFLVENLHDYKGIQVSGSHMVNEDNTWVRVEDSKHGKSLGDDEHVVYVFGSENRRILINDILFTDYFEVKDQEQLLKEKDKFFDNWKTFAINEDSSNVNTLNAN